MDRIADLLHSLNDANVRYVVIGATAFAAHGWVRATADLDLYVDPELTNVERLRAALAAFGYDLADASVADFQQYKILLRQYELPLDLHPFVKGVAAFDGIWQRRVVAEVGGVKAPFASLDDLIAMKRAAGRTKDQLDLIELEKLKSGGIR